MCCGVTMASDVQAALTSAEYKCVMSMLSDGKMTSAWSISVLYPFFQMVRPP